MTEAEALRDVRGYASANRYMISSHAHDSMRKRRVCPRDVHSALCQATSCKGQESGRWKVTGPDEDGDTLDVVVVIEDGLVVVTVY